MEHLILNLKHFEMFSRCFVTLDNWILMYLAISRRKFNVHIQKQIDCICKEIREEQNKNKPPATGGDFGKRDFGKQYPNLDQKKESIPDVQ